MLEFEWDPRKARANAVKHGIAFEEATSVFEDPLALTVSDDRFDEQRFFTVGRSRRGKIIVIAHADRGDRVRIISARQATRREREQYEQG